MDIEKRQMIEDLGIKLKDIDDKISDLQAEIDRLNGDRKAILEQIQQNSDEEYEKNALEKLYEQRKKFKA